MFRSFGAVMFLSGLVLQTLVLVVIALNLLGILATGGRDWFPYITHDHLFYTFFGSYALMFGAYAFPAAGYLRRRRS